jgi:hypothetical protein
VTRKRAAQDRSTIRRVYGSNCCRRNHLGARAV